MSKNISRRDAIKTIGLTWLAAPSILDFDTNTTNFNRIKLNIADLNSKHKNFNKPLTYIIIGDGNRGWGYSLFSSKYPKEMKVIGIAEPVKIRQEKFKEEHNLDKQNIFNTRQAGI